MRWYAPAAALVSSAQPRSFFLTALRVSRKHPLSTCSPRCSPACAEAIAVASRPAGAVCRYHGGSTAHIKRKAKERLDRDQDLATMRAIVRRTLGDLAIPAGKARNAFAARPEALPPPAQRVCEVNIDAGQGKPTPEPPQITREEHRARQSLPTNEPPALSTPDIEVVDAEVVPEQEPPVSPPSAVAGAAGRPDQARRTRRRIGSAYRAGNARAADVDL